MSLAMLGDILTGADLRFTLVYLVPILFGAWFRGGAWGSFLSGLATIGVLLAEHTGERRLPLAIIVWNTAGVLAMMLVVVWALDALKRFVDDKEQKLRIAVDQLRHAERLSMIGRLAAGVAHELGTPLNVIAGHAELLMMAGASANLATSTRAITEQTARMAAIIRHLLDFGRRHESERIRVDLNTLTTATAKMVERLIMKGASRLSLALSDEPIDVVVNPRELEQVLMNLIVNAQQSMPSGGVIRLRTKIEDASSSDGLMSPVACVSVMDEGVGIEADDLGKIFDPFFTTKDVGAGTGLGLSVSYAIVTDHGGRIDVETERGRGSLFTVRLPLASSRG